MLKIILTLSLITIISSLPLDDDKSDEERGLSINDFFASLNGVLKRDIIEDIGNDTSVEHGDKIKDQNGNVVISVQTFSFGTDNFPLVFKPNNESLADDKEISPLVGGFESDSAIFKIENEEETTVSSENVKNTTSTTESSNSTIKSTKEQKLLKEIAQQPILTNV
ncbi:hypothetical protein PVAND_008312 [Polypedilum vanderplanki]|uniref:Uncharacterized protein n=1 Tax=Polypedilum vanderplanki TaxID=319348 RepID=A0A9J6C989_POLVA|nr:hypothetical protein PVAND_008312 [Polypedilum vanderplanki]